MDTSGAKHQVLGETALLADGRVAVVGIGDSLSRDAVSQAAARWSSGYPGLRRALERSTRQHLPPKLHRFFRAANDALVFICHVDSDGDAKCHVVTADAECAFGIAEQGQNYWVYKSGLVSKDSFIDATTGGWLLEVLPWDVPELNAEASTEHLILAYFLLPKLASLERPNIELRPGIWRTCNRSIVALSRMQDGYWGATVILGGNRFGEIPGAFPGSHYKLDSSGAVLWVDSDATALPRSLRKLAAVSGMALLVPLEISDTSGKEIILL